jgi:hypothetical protein
MSRIRILGLALVAAFAMSAVAATAASAAPVWEEEVGGVFKPITVAKASTSTGTLKLKDTGTLLGESEVECTGTDKGTVGAGSADTITEIKATECKGIKVCKAPVTAEALNVAPKLAGGVWQTALETVGTETRDKVTTTSGTKVVGWTVTCETSFGKQTDVCESASTTTAMTNNANGTVTATFDAKSPSAKCSLGNATSGHVLGTDVLKAAVPIRVK